MRSGVRKKWDDLNFKAESFYRKYEYRKKAKLRLKRMNGGCKCTKEYNEIVIHSSVVLVRTNVYMMFFSRI